MLWIGLILAAGVAWADTGSRACAPCHKEIFEKHQRSGMARSSGRVGDGFEKFDAAAFRVDGVDYRVTPAFRLQTAKSDAGMDLFVGSGAVGRSYAAFIDGFLFQSPASYYSARAAWGLSPGFDVKTVRPIENACLQCHASGVRAVAGTQNKYLGPPFLEGGVSCERCHGPGEAHVAGRGAMLNPAKLAPARRDSVCLQCHLTGAARVAQPGRGPATFRVGDLLSNHVMVFVWSRADDMGRAATDHAEQLARSKCQIAAGDKLWCGSCHDAHEGSTRRTACLDCHQQHANGGPDCAGCHMPKRRSSEGEHVAYTDHTILRRPGAGSGTRVLQAFRGMAASERDWALAEPRLARLEKLAAAPEADAAVLVQLAQLYDAKEKGAPLYERALRLEPGHATAQANLAVYRMKVGRVREALDLWARAFAQNPGMIGPGLNLAMGQMQIGDREGASATLRRVLRFHPDSRQAAELLWKLR
jgi:hypothetical protein